MPAPLPEPHIKFQLRLHADDYAWLQMEHENVAGFMRELVRRYVAHKRAQGLVRGALPDSDQG